MLCGAKSRRRSGAPARVGLSGAHFVGLGAVLCSGALFGLGVLGGVQEARAQGAVCDNPGAFCSRSFDNRCLSRVGAGVLGVDPGDDPLNCQAEIAAYRDCLSLVAAQCPRGDAPATSASAAPVARGSAIEVWREIKSIEDADVLESFADSYPGSPLAVLARKRATALRAAASRGQTIEAAPEAPKAAEVEESERAAAEQEVTLREQFRAAQENLARIGYAPGPIDGQWGARSAAALAAFQRDQGAATADGMLTPGVMAELKAAPDGSAPKTEPVAEPQHVTREAPAAKQGGGGVARFSITFQMRNRSIQHCTASRKTPSRSLNLSRVKLSCARAYLSIKTDASGRALSASAELRGQQVVLNGSNWRYSGLRSGESGPSSLRSAKLTVDF